MLSTNINLEDGTCALDLVLSAAEYFGLGFQVAKCIIREVARVTATWRDVAVSYDVRQEEIRRMESAFEHRDLKQALAR